MRENFAVNSSKIQVSQNGQVSNRRDELCESDLPLHKGQN